MSVVYETGGKGAGWVEDRLGSSGFLRRQLNKVFPDHWSFMLGEIALYSFIIILLTGVYLTLWFKPSMIEIVYDGSYAPLKGVKMSEAMASTLDISFDVRGGLLIRQIHHMAALFFVAAIAIHLLRVFFTGAFRKPRELNWVIGVVLFLLSIAAGFSGYSLPDDLLSGTGLRITQGIIQASPVIGTWFSFLLFDGEFPGTSFIPRLYGVHILLVPGLILGLVTAHLMMVWYQKHTQFPGPGRTNDNVVGYPLMPVYMAKAGGFFFVVFGTIVALAGLFQINPIWAYGPYIPDQVTAGSQPDWYVGFLDGALRLMPPWEIVAFGHTLSLNLIVPAMVLAPLLLVLVGAYPWIEKYATRDNREHHLLDRPRNAPTRTALGAAMLTFYIVLMIGGGNDIIAYNFGLSFNSMIRVLQVLLFVGPIVAFIVAKRMALSLQRRDRDLLLHGRETGRVLRLPSGEFLEIHAPVDEEYRAKILSKTDVEPLALPETVDENGVANPARRRERSRSGFSRFFYKDNVPLPTDEELAVAQLHIDHELHDAVESGSQAAAEIAEHQH
ncbi:MAG TPA: ubiquinol-cytochrome c reductase cytochrome b subunit [Dermatophilaceae bacterium]|nr:ubiquinol-cytochrome c reductase cytochrome b subunit [Dermatophilaceae bacterium]